MRRFALTIWLAFFSFAVIANQAVYLTGLRIQPSANLTRITFTLTEKTSGKVKFLPDPARVIVDFANTRKRFILQHVQLTGSNIKALNAIDTLNGGVRFILTVYDKVSWKILFLPEKNGMVQMQLEIRSVNPAPKITPPSIQQKTSINSQQTILNSFAQLAKEANQKILAQDKLVKENSNNITVASVKKTGRVYTVVIDPGHGGKDPGAHGKHGVKEKHVVLAIAKKLAEQINQQPYTRAILTRKGDYFVPLRERTKLARRGKADLFVAIHADAYFDNNASGAAIFALSKHGATSEAARWLAQRENYSELGGVELDALKDRSPQLRSVLIDLAQTATIRDSIRLGNKVLDALDDISSMHYQHVEQAPFVVLKSPDIPSVLIETGFITNPREEKRLMDPAYQDKLASALAKGINGYVQKYAMLEE